jgi:hypothetical protein
VKDIGVVLRVPQEIHARFKAGCAKHDRSMQKVLVTLIEGWVANGAPEPSGYGGQHVITREETATHDQEARDGLTELAKALKKMEERITELENEKVRTKMGTKGMKQFYEIMKGDEECDKVK